MFDDSSSSSGNGADNAAVGQFNSLTSECEIRVKLLPGYCRVQLTFGEFDLYPARLMLDRSSPSVCIGEHLELAGVQYCGQELRNSSRLLTTTLPNQRHISLRATLASPSAFRAIFKQLECEASPLKPLNQLTGPSSGHDNHHLSNLSKFTTDSFQLTNNFKNDQRKQQQQQQVKSSAPSNASQLASSDQLSGVNLREILIRDQFFELNSAKLLPAATDESNTRDSAHVQHAHATYKPNMFVIYRLLRASPTVCKIRLMFYKFDLEPPERSSSGSSSSNGRLLPAALVCKRDFLDINSTDRLCGSLDVRSSDSSREYDWPTAAAQGAAQGAAHEDESDHNQFKISFVSDSVDQRSGFHIFGQQISDPLACSGHSGVSKASLGTSLTTATTTTAISNDNNKSKQKMASTASHAAHATHASAHAQDNSAVKTEEHQNFNQEQQHQHQQQAVVRSQEEESKRAKQGASARQLPANCSVVIDDLNFELSSLNWPRPYEAVGTCHYLIRRSNLVNVCSVTLRINSMILDIERASAAAADEDASGPNGAGQGDGSCGGGGGGASQSELAHLSSTDYLELDGQTRLCGLLSRPRTFTFDFASPTGSGPGQSSARSGQRQFIIAKFVSNTARGFGFHIEGQQNKCPEPPKASSSSEGGGERDRDADSTPLVKYDDSSKSQEQQQQHQQQQHQQQQLASGPIKSGGQGLQQQGPVSRQQARPLQQAPNYGASSATSSSSSSSEEFEQPTANQQQQQQQQPNENAHDEVDSGGQAVASGTGSARSCNRLLTDQVNLIESDKFPSKQYANNNNCLFAVRRLNQSICAIDLILNYFDLENSNEFSGLCESDYIEIDYSRFCGSYPTGHKLRFNYFDNELDKLIRFRTNAALTRNGFSIMVKQVMNSDCDQSSSSSPVSPLVSSSGGGGGGGGDGESAVGDGHGDDSQGLHATRQDTDTPTDSHAATSNIGGGSTSGSGSSLSADGQTRQVVSYHLLDSTSGSGSMEPERAIGSELATNRNSTSSSSSEAVALQQQRQQQQLDIGGSALSRQPSATLCKFVYHSERQFLVSPNYNLRRDHYDNNLDCQYKIVAASYDICALKLTILDLDLEQSQDCLNDYLLIDNRRYCGREQHLQQMTDKNAGAAGTAAAPIIELDFSPNLPREIDLIFHTDLHVNSGRGFKLLSEQVACNQQQQQQPASSGVGGGGGTIDQEFRVGASPDNSQHQLALDENSVARARQVRRMRFGQLNYPKNYVSVQSTSSSSSSPAQLPQAPPSTSMRQTNWHANRPTQTTLLNSSQQQQQQQVRFKPIAANQPNDASKDNISGRARQRQQQQQQQQQEQVSSEAARREAGGGGDDIRENSNVDETGQGPRRHHVAFSASSGSAEEQPEHDFKLTKGIVVARTNTASKQQQQQQQRRVDKNQIPSPLVT